MSKVLAPHRSSRPGLLCELNQLRETNRILQAQVLEERNRRLKAVEDIDYLATILRCEQDRAELPSHAKLFGIWADAVEGISIRGRRDTPPALRQVGQPVR
jgi:hypothetical protein